MEKKIGSRNILSLLQAAIDPETGAKLDFKDLLVNSYAIVYPSQIHELLAS